MTEKTRGTETDPETLGGRIKELRLAREWTQTELGYHAKTTPSEISRIERGQRVRSDMLERIAEALSVDVADLFPKGPAPSRTTGEGASLAALVRGLYLWAEELEKAAYAEANSLEAVLAQRRAVGALLNIVATEAAAIEAEQGDMPPDEWHAFNETLEALYRAKAAGADRRMRETGKKGGKVAEEVPEPVPDNVVALREKRTG